jgi:muramoyltetrapeptide carboxypeptidase LdcA involved in peptidoglycan recycling
MTRVPGDLIHPPKARPGDRIAVLSPSFAAAGAFPDVHEQAMRRLREVTGLIPVEYPTTREVGATPRARAADINAAFADPSIWGILAVIGGEDHITVIPHLDAGLARRDPGRGPAEGYGSARRRLLSAADSLRAVLQGHRS